MADGGGGLPVNGGDVIEVLSHSVRIRTTTAVIK